MDPARPFRSEWKRPMEPGPAGPLPLRRMRRESRNAHENANDPIRTLVARRLSRRGANAEKACAGAGRGRAVGQCLPLTDRDRQAFAARLFRSVQRDAQPGQFVARIPDADAARRLKGTALEGGKQQLQAD